MDKWAVVLLGVLMQCAPSSQGGGCLLKDPEIARQIGLHYLEEFPVMMSPTVQGVHLALNGPSQMRVTWMNPAHWNQGSNFDPACIFGLTPTLLNANVSGRAYSYPDGDFTWTLNTAILNLALIHSPNGLYYYKCGDPKYGWSPILNFTLQSVNIKDGGSSPKIAFVGDWGVKRGEYTMASITEHTNKGDVQLVVHSGDICYANKYGRQTGNNSYVWVEYMNRLQPMMSHVPYMVAPGNHESQFQFAAYLNWLQMPSAKSNSTSPFWFSFDYLGIHFVSMSTEHDFGQNSSQHDWLQQDLRKANTNRDNVPWIIVYGHRPLYCSSIACVDRCRKEAVLYRAYLEELLVETGVDVFMSAHNHQYERSYPVYRQKPLQTNYTDAQAPVYIVNGAAGNPEWNDPTFAANVDWRAFYEGNFDTGYLLLQPSRHRLSFQYVLSKTNTVADQFTLVKTEKWH